MARTAPDLTLERELLADATVLALVDEVGRGCLGGPVSCGVVAIDGSVGEAPEGVADSKELSAAARDALVGPIREWALGSAVGHASAAEIDCLGITAALRLAANRALEGLAARGIVCDTALLDGPHDWLSAPAQGDLFDEHASAGWAGRVVCRVKADATCAGVAAASVLAKVERDALVEALEVAHPGYGWAEHKGYGTPAHLAAIGALGASAAHRHSFAPLSQRR